MGLGRSTLSFAALTPAQIPTAKTPRIVVVGRSNVGKSSLLNAMTHPQKIFRTGKTPGLTRGVLGAHIQLSAHKDSLLEVIDVPGTGFARNPHEKEAWVLLVDELRTKSMNKSLMILWLVEIGRRPEQEDLDLLKWMGQIPFVIVFTKIDKVSKSQIPETEKYWKSLLETAVDKPLFVSATKNEGLNELFKAMKSFVRMGSPSL